MNRFTLAIAAVLFTFAGLTPGVACAAEPTGVNAALADADGALERVLNKDETLRTRIAQAYRAPAADNAVANSIERSKYSSAALYRLLQPAPAAVAAR